MDNVCVRVESENSARVEFLETRVFPVLLPGLEATLRTAKCTERRKRFNPVNFLAAYLFRNNPNGSDERTEIDFKDIPFVKQKWSTDPPSQLPLSATLTEEEAATIIQAYYRGHLLRCTNKHVIEFCKWQKRYAQETVAVRKIQKWWRELRQRHSKAREKRQDDAEATATSTSNAVRVEEEN